MSELRGPNGCCFDRDERYLYVALTAAGKIQRIGRMPDGSLGQREDYGPVLGSVTPNAMIADILKLSREERRLLGYPNGIAFDASGNLWISLRPPMLLTNDRFHSATPSALTARLFELQDIIEPLRPRPSP